MDDPVLGRLEPDFGVEGCLLATVPFEGSELELSVEPDGVDLHSCLALAHELVASLKVLEAKARVVAADRLLDLYNRDWRNVSADGSAGGVANPRLSATEFAQRLRLAALGVTGNSTIELWFEDGGLFAGCSVSVLSMNGTTFTDTSATLFG